MTDNEKKRSYERYVQWQENKIKYRNESIAYALMFCAGLLFILKNLRGIFGGLGIMLVIFALFLFIRILKKWYQMQNALSHIKLMLEEMGAKDIEINNSSISFSMSSGFENEQYQMIGSVMADKGIKMKMERQVTNEQKNIQLNPTDRGYINRNQQKNIGRTDKRGSDYNQYFYDMECLQCGCRYQANGTDIWHRKCPACQGGKP